MAVVSCLALALARPTWGSMVRTSGVARVARALSLRRMRMSSLGADAGDDSAGGGRRGGGDGRLGGGGGGGGGRGGDADNEPQLPIGWPFAVPLLHALNKGLLCASVPPELRDLTARLTDVGFLSFLGGLAALASFARTGYALSSMRFALVQIGLGHMVFESLVNGVLLPLFRNPEKGAHSRTLRPGIWAHHACAIVAFAAVLRFRVFVPQAVLLTMTECTAGLPAAFQEARKAKRAHGALSLTLAALLLVGFAGRCALSAAVVVPTAPATFAALADVAAGRCAAPAVALAQGVVWACAAVLTALNLHWFGKVLQGAAKVGAKPRAKLAVAAAR